MTEPTPSRRERERQQRHSDILDAASRVFADRGYAVATMGDVAAEAELSKGTLYLYFENKESLFLSLSNRLLDAILHRAEEIAKPDVGSGAQRFEAMLNAWAENATSNQEKFRVLVSRLASKATVDVASQAFLEHRKRVDRLIGYWIGALESGKADGSIRQDVAPLASAVEAWGGLLGVVLVSLNFEELQKRFPRRLAQSQLIPEFIDTLVRGLKS